MRVSLALSLIFFCFSISYGSKTIEFDELWIAKTGSNGEKIYRLNLESKGSFIHALESAYERPSQSIKLSTLWIDRFEKENKKIFPLDVLTYIHNHFPINNNPMMLYLNHKNQNLQKEFIEFNGRLPLLRQLTFEKSTQSDFSSLSKYQNLTKINLDDSRIENLSFVQYLPKLKEIRACKTKISDLTPLTNNETIEDIRLDDCPLNNISPLFTMKKLKQVGLGSLEIKQEDINELLHKKKIRVWTNSRKE